MHGHGYYDQLGQTISGEKPTCRVVDCSGYSMLVASVYWFSNLQVVIVKRMKTKTRKMTIFEQVDIKTNVAAKKGIKTADLRIMNDTNM